MNRQILLSIEPAFDPDKLDILSKTLVGGLRGLAQRTSPLAAKIFFHFHADLGEKIGEIVGLRSHPQESAPFLGNSGSATVIKFSLNG